MSFARFNATELNSLESTVFKINVAEYHLSKSERNSFYYMINLSFSINFVFTVTTHLQLTNFESLYWRFSKDPLKVLPLCVSFT